MDYQIEILDDIGLEERILSLINSAVISTLRFIDHPPTSLSIFLTDDESVQKLNLQYRQINSPTDVLSFTVNEIFPGEDGEYLYLGDIAISIPYAKRESTKKGVSYIEELQLLTVHGVLHLVGFDHLAEQEKDEMWAMQKDILISLGLSGLASTIE